MVLGAAAADFGAATGAEGLAVAMAAAGFVAVDFASTPALTAAGAVLEVAAVDLAIGDGVVAVPRDLGAVSFVFAAVVWVVVDGFAAIEVAAAEDVAAAGATLRVAAVSGFFAADLVAVAAAGATDVDFAAVAGFAAEAFAAAADLAAGVFTAVAGFAAGAASVVGAVLEAAAEGFSLVLLGGITAVSRADGAAVAFAGTDFDAAGCREAFFAAGAADGFELAVVFAGAAFFAGAAVSSTEFLSVVGLATTLLS
ncbi:hypothetical protein ACIPUB_09520 [Paeniglutamicibacter sp. ORCA_105]|uniref:hypothetical protein n=1 Tax=Paeniglutamicibacter sp. ORCA_105 TaxID=3377336 RepID=UPI003894CB89